MGGQAHWLGDVQPKLSERSQSADTWWQCELSKLCYTWFMSQGLDFVIWTVHDLRILQVIQKIFDPWYDDVLIQCSTGCGGSALVAAMAVLAGQGTTWTKADSWLNPHDDLICLLCFLDLSDVHLDVVCCLGNACVMHFGTEKEVVSEHRPGCYWPYDDELLAWTVNLRFSPKKLKNMQKGSPPLWNPKPTGKLLLWTVLCNLCATLGWVFAPCALLRFGCAVCKLRDEIREIVAGQSCQG